MKSLFIVSFALVARAQDGTCVAGQDMLGVEQSCLGRCHIYHAGEYGACNSYQVTQQDAEGPCGDSPQNACISTFNGGWDTQHLNCGNCYYVEMEYDDGTVRSTYVKTIDTNGSETKFEMSQVAWTNLCPYMCKADGTCTHDPSTCTWGADLDEHPMPAPCYVQHAPITFKRVPCDGDTAVTKAPVVTHAPTSTTTHPPTPAHPHTSTDEDEMSTKRSVYKPTQAPAVRPSRAPTSRPTKTPSAKPTKAPAKTQASEVTPVNNIEVCKSIVHNDQIADWDKGCKDLCDYYATQPIHCPGLANGTALAACVHRLHSYCAL
eukprot:Blabericola_migrator_1__8161@NODE_4210_length_1279_cov_1212_539604_g2604_i0_p1_GENE_NODE_4210_length_1279_cov_1212_539604_g2604_i0NODE_4210_length_1279_cov_1212_539604_g2604_i0_p1_ORF_typecomplete_len319_score65_58PT/PF04886_12/1_8e04PT/PF04886_12/6_5e05SCRL/PF06876_12/1_9SCRL/PF06876_12/2_7e02_NODE_4210_length_1279_cov_1212_539604_g2604_i01121068